MKLRHRLYWSSASLLAALLAAPAVGAVRPASDQAASQPEEALVSVSINGSPAGEPLLLFRLGNKFYATAESLSSWRLKHGLKPAVTRDGVAYYLLNDIAGVNVEFEETTQSLTLRAEPRLFAPTRLAYPKVELSDEVVGGTGGFLNYEGSAQVADGLVTGGGAIELGVFTPRGVGVSGFVGRSSGSGAELIRLDTNWTMDDPARMRSLRFGDSVSRGGVGGTPLRFGGIQIARNFGVQPGFITIPLPSARGSAALPSVVDVYVDGTLRDRSDVPPGPFEITDVPIVTGSGDVQLVVRDLLGRERLYTQSYYAAPKLLREGLHDYSYEAGFLRRSFGRESHDYGALMLSATHRYGFSNTLTGEVHLEATKDVQTVGAAAAFTLADTAHVEASLAGSQSKLGGGAQAGLTIERRTRGLSLGFSTEFTTNNYMALGWSADRRPPASIIQAFAGMPLDFGSLGLSYLRRDSRTEPDAEYVSANSSFRLGRLGSLHIAGRKSLTGKGGLAAEIFLTVPMGPQANTTAGASLTAGNLAFRSTVERNVPVGVGWGYRLSASAGASDRFDGRIAFNTSFGAYDAQLTWTDGKTGVRFSTAGGFGFVDGKAFASRQLTQSFASVKVGNYSNVRVYADNQFVGRTDGNGRIIVPKLRPFDRNRLRIELADLPLDAEISSEEVSVRPYDRHGVEVVFAAKPTRSAIIRILLDDGSPLAAGSTVRLDNGPEEFVSAPGGEVYVTGLESMNTATVTGPNGLCQVRFPFPETDDPQPRLGDVRCRAVVQ